mmetsp:Transcript_6401/g.16219  ORF Transcript_6401/g.16219 Transcript_6401/m.16219 type:complete len:961 (-) Transcript_6401:1939-4821(-)
MMLSSLRYFEDLRSNSTVVRPPGQVLDIVVDAGSTSTSSGSTQPEMAFCHFIALCPFVDTSQVSVMMGLEAAYAVALAVHHLNSGDGQVIKEVGGLNDRCPIKFTLQFEDTKLDPGVGLNHVVESTDNNRRRIETGNSTQLSSVSSRLPSVFLGAFRSAVSVPTSLVSGLRGYPQISGASTSVQLNDKTTYPKFARTIPADNGVTEGIILYLRDTLDLNYVAVLHANDAFGNSYFSGLLDAASVHAPEMSLLQITIDADVAADEDNVRQAMKTLKDAQYRFVIAVLISPDMHDAVMLEALGQNVAGNGEYNWMFSDASVQFMADRTMSVDSDLSRAYNYAGVFKAAGNQGERYAEFEKQMEALANPEDIAYVDNMISLATAADNDDPPEYISPGFLKPVQFGFSAFVFEAAIAAGLAACEKVGQDLTLTGDDFYDSILTSPPFESLSGSIAFDPKTGSRLPSSAFYELSNFRGQERIDPTSGEMFVKFEEVTTALYHKNTWTEVTPFIFSDGTTKNARGTPNVTIDQNLISTGMRAVAFSFMAVSIIFAIAFAAWTKMNRISRVVRASQPFFLYLISVGCIIFSLAIVPLQYDTSFADVEACSKACISTAWLVSLGFSCIYSALYAKTYRINKVMEHAKHYKRITVSLKSTLVPVGIIISANLVLLASMTVINAPQYEIFVVQTDRFEQPIETYGSCVWEESVAFIAPLTALNIGVVLLALYEAWKSRFLATEFAESQHIGRAVIGTLIVAGIGLPVLVIAKDNPDASLFVSSGIIFVMCILTLGCIFAPKIRYDKESKQQPTRNVRISGFFYGSHPPSGDLNMISAAICDTGMPNNKTRKNSRSFDRKQLSNVSEHSQASGTSESNEIGERILTTKTRKELLQDMELLQVKYDKVKNLLLLEREQKCVVGDSEQKKDEAMESFVPLKMAGTEHSCVDSVPSNCCARKEESFDFTSDVEE